MGEADPWQPLPLIEPLDPVREEFSSSDFFPRVTTNQVRLLLSRHRKPLTRPAIYKLIKRKGLPAVLRRIRGRWEYYFDKRDIMRWIRSGNVSLDNE